MRTKKTSCEFYFKVLHFISPTSISVDFIKLLREKMHKAYETACATLRTESKMLNQSRRIY